MCRHRQGKGVIIPAIYHSRNSILSIIGGARSSRSGRWIGWLVCVLRALSLGLVDNGYVACVLEMGCATNAGATMVTDINLDEIIEEMEGAQAPGRVSPARLLWNPFPVTGIGGMSNHLIPPFEPAISLQVREFLRVALSSREFTGLMIVGDYGLGKTHLLRWIERVINTATSTVHDRLVRAYYVSNPGIRPMDVLMSVTRAIGDDNFRKMIWTVVAADLRTHAAQGPAAVHALFTAETRRTLLDLTDEQIKALVHADSLASFDKFREHFQASFLAPTLLRGYVSRVLSTITVNQDVAQTLTSMLLDDEAHAFTSWVSLISTEGRQQLRVPQEDYFQAILNVIKYNGIGSIFLLIDEFEDVVGLRLSSRQRAEYLATLRLLIATHMRDFSLVVALAPQAWDLTKSLHPPFVDRVGRRVIDIRPLTPERAEQLVKSYLAQARSSDNGAESQGLAPFTVEAVKAMLHRSEGNTRAFVSICYRVLEHSWTKQEIGVDDVLAVAPAA